MLTPGDYPTQPSSNFRTSTRWFKNKAGWCSSIVRSYPGTGVTEQEYVDWGLSDQEYFKRKLAGTAK